MLSFITPKVVLFPEICRVKKFLSLTSRHSRLCIRIYIFNLKSKQQEDEKEKKLNKKREYL